MKTFTLTASGPFSLTDSIRFLESFTPAEFTGAVGRPLDLAFPVEDSWRTVGVRVREDVGGGVTGEIISPAAPDPVLLAQVRAQVARILSLDIDGSGFPAVGERDPVVARLRLCYPGWRPVGFWSPYEAAAWAVIGHRIRIKQAAGIKAAMARQLGERADFDGNTVYAFPAPDRLAALDSF